MGIAQSDSETQHCWVVQNKGLLFTDENTPILLYGESSGGNLATAALLYNENANVQGNILVYPSLDYYQPYPSKKEFAKGYLLDEDVRLWLACNYLNNENERKNTLVSLILSDRLRVLPRTLIISAHFDPLRDEAQAFYQELIKNGVSAHLTEFDTIHGFISMQIEPYCKMANDQIIGFINSVR